MEAATDKAEAAKRVHRIVMRIEAMIPGAGEFEQDLRDLACLAHGVLSLAPRLCAEAVGEDLQRVECLLGRMEAALPPVRHCAGREERRRAH